MKTKLLSLAALLAAAPAAFAWPFVERGTGLTGTGVQALERPIAIQTDSDRPLEIFAGGTQFANTFRDASNFLAAQRVDLPLPDYDPYPAGAAQVSFAPGGGTAGDIDGDGDTDIVYTTRVQYNGAVEATNVRVVACRNNGNGTWTRLWQIKQSNGLRSLPVVKLADLDRDGDPDFIESSSGVRIRWNDGTGNHSSTTTLTTLVQEVTDIEIGDFDGNGWPDVAVFGGIDGVDPNFPTNWPTGRLTVFWNNGGTFTTQNVQTLPAHRVYISSGVADLNGDGRPDLISVRSGDSSMDLQWHRSTGSGFANPVLLHSSPNQIRFAPADLDEDGLPDLVFSTRGKEAQWLRGLGGGTFAATEVLHAGDGSAGGSRLCVADIDGDGDPDIALFGGEVWLENQSIRMQPAATVTSWTGVNPSGTVSLATGDVDNDGRPDLIAGDGGAKRIRWYRGTGSGLQSPSIVSTGDLEPLGVVCGDFNRDGFNDLMWSADHVVYKAISTNGSGYSWTTGSAFGALGVGTLVAEDMDRDGDPDLLCLIPSLGGIRVYRNNGDASAWSLQSVDTGLPGLAGIAAGQTVPGGLPEIHTLGSSVVNRHSHQGGSWTYGSLGSQSGGTGSKGLAVAAVDDGHPGPGVIYSLNTNAIYYKHDSFLQPRLLVADTGHPVTRLIAVDWNRDGHTDILAATAHGVSLYPHAGTPHASFGPPVHFITGVPVQDLVVMPLNGDAYPDAVAARSGTGELHLITNQSAAVEVLATPRTTQTLAPGGTGTAINLGCHHRGQRLHETSCAPAEMLIRFRRSQTVDGVETPGTGLNQSEVAALVENVSLQVAGLQPVAPTGVADGWFAYVLDGNTRQGLAVANRSSRSIDLQVKLKSTAGSSAVQRFYVEFFPGGNLWVEQDGFASNPRPVRKRGTTASQSTLFVVRPPTALENWRMTHFGTYAADGSSANDADPNGNGVPNIVEYVMGRDPKGGAGIAGTTPVELTYRGENLPALADLRLLTAYDGKVRVTLQYSSTLGSWSTLATRTGTGAWTGTQPTGTAIGGGRTRWSFNSGLAPAVVPKLFYRLLVEELP